MYAVLLAVVRRSFEMLCGGCFGPRIHLSENLVVNSAEVFLELLVALAFGIATASKLPISRRFGEGWTHRYFVLESSPRKFLLVRGCKVRLIDVRCTTYGCA